MNVNSDSSLEAALIHGDDFRHGLSQWRIEQQPGGRVFLENRSLIIEDHGGCTVWFAHPLDAPVKVTYDAIVSSKARVSDLNCFWMASEPDRPDDLFADGFERDGSFAAYDRLQTYYVGCGGNHNSTTRFRRYLGKGDKPLLKEYDLSSREHLLDPDLPNRIALIAAHGKAVFRRNGHTVFSFDDPAPLTRGWFGFRTVLSRLEIRNFRVFRI